MFKLIRRVISLILAIVIIVPGYALFITWKSAHHPPFRNSADVIVVPGAAQLNGAPGEVLLARLEEAKQLRDKGYAPLIITVGAGAPGDRTTEAAAGKFWLSRNGVPKAKIISLPVGRDTFSQTKAYIAEMKKRNIYNVNHRNRCISLWSINANGQRFRCHRNMFAGKDRAKFT